MRAKARDQAGREMTNGVLGINVMVALSNFADGEDRHSRGLT